MNCTKSTQYAPKLAYLRSKVDFSSPGPVSTPSPDLTPLGAFGASILAPTRRIRRLDSVVPALLFQETIPAYESQAHNADKPITTLWALYCYMNTFGIGVVVKCTRQGQWLNDTSSTPGSKMMHGAPYRPAVCIRFLRATAGTAIARLSHRNSVRLSVCLSVCHTGGSGKNGAS